MVSCAQVGIPYTLLEFTAVVTSTLVRGVFAVRGDIFNNMYSATTSRRILNA